MPETMEHKTVVDATRSERVAAAPVRAEHSKTRSRWWRDARRRRMLACADVLSGLLAIGLVAVPATHSPWALVFVPLWPLAAKLFGLYDRDHRALRHLTADEVPVLAAWAATLTAAVALFLPLTPAGTLGGISIIALFAVATLLATGLRSFARWAWWKATPPERVRLVGDGPLLESLRRKVAVFSEMHLELSSEVLISDVEGARSLDDELNSLAVGVDRIVVAAEGVEASLIGELKGVCRRRQVKLSVVSPLRGPAAPSDWTAHLDDLPILEYNTWDQSRSSLAIKRITDIIVSSIGLILFSPILLVSAIAIKLDSPGPVFFSQIRAGRDRRPFRMYKLRTMVADAEAQLGELVDIDELADPMFKLRDDPRITRVGSVLRRFSLDEFPQLFNVLVGEMSIVGPRPEQVELVERYTGDALAKMAVKPGVTGPMQVFGRGELTFDERIAVELDYVENASLARDLEIMIHTLPAVLRGTGAY